MKIDKTLLAIVVPIVVTLGGGLIEMRVAIARLQSDVSSISQRVDRIENRLDVRVSSRDTP